MKILIIGSKGFIGSHCVKYFENENEVYKADIIKCSENNYTFLKKESIDFESLFIKNKYDVCINATGSANVAFSFENSFVDFNLNVVNVSKILNAINKYNKECKLINFSSAAVYGNPINLPIHENHPLNPISPYGFHKQQSERLLYEFSKIFGLKTISLRVFSVYGEGLKKQLFWDLYKKTTNSDIIQLYGTGKETRDFIYIKDLLSAIQLIIIKANFNGDVINIANGIEKSVNEVTNLFFKNLKPNIKIMFKGDCKKGDPINVRADISKLELLGYRPKIHFEEGIKNYIKWIKE